MNKLKSRSPALDIIRCFALFCVVSVHFFLNNGFYKQTVIGERMYVLTLMRSFFMICVPLFLLLTGYLTRKKQITKDYYFKLFYTLGIYILASLVCIAYRLFIKHEEISFIYLIGGFFGYKNAPYSWYIELYIGLFLLSPFLNVLYNNLNSKRKKQILLFTFILLTSLPSIINVYRPEPSWFLNPSSSTEYAPFLPDWWINIYPVTYYFIGCYLSEYKIKLRVRYQILILILVILLNGTYNFYRSYNTVFMEGPWQHYYGITQIVQAVLVFSIFSNLNYSKLPAKLCKFLGKISGLCLGGYLVSWVFDNYFYQFLNAKVPNMPERLNYYLLIVPFVYICSITLSYLINIIYKYSELLVVKIYHKVRKTVRTSD